MHSETPSKSTSTKPNYGVVETVHFTINHNKRGWHITEFSPHGMPIKTHGPFPDPLSRLDALSYLISITNLE